jgi:U3 small nucleolar RNA-associated protein 3
MYLLLKASRVNVQNHPVIKRLYQYRELLSQLAPVYEEIMKPQIELLLIEEEKEEIQKKTLNVLSQLMEKTGKKGQKKKAETVEGEAPSKKVKFNEEVMEKTISDNEEQEEEEEVKSRKITRLVSWRFCD